LNASEIEALFLELSSGYFQLHGPVIFILSYDVTGAYPLEAGAILCIDERVLQTAGRNANVLPLAPISNCMKTHKTNQML